MDDGYFDVVILGTGLTESITAASATLIIEIAIFLTTLIVLLRKLASE